MTRDIWDSSLRARIACFAILCMLAASCAKNAVANHPGAVNAFDSGTYDALRTAKASLDEAGKSVTPQSPTAIRNTYNAVGRSYQTVKDAYVAYHTQAVAGFPPDTTALSAAVTKLVGDIAALVAQLKGGGK